MDKTFCLVSELWIKATDLNGVVNTYSLQNVLTSAHKIHHLAGDLIAQDVSVLRFMLSILETVVYRYDENSNRNDIKTPEEALRRWDEIRKMGHFPERAITNYLKEWEDYFYLVHPTHPFYQVTKRPKDENGKEKNGTRIDYGRLIGSISESDNKPRFHSMYSTAGKRSIDDGELARWILYFQNYDHKATKPKNAPGVAEKDKIHPRVCWCANLGIVYAEGKTLFETLLLNLVLLRTDVDEETCFGEPKPHWENFDRPMIEDHVLEYPDNLAQLFSMPGRYLYTEKDDRSFYMEAFVAESIPVNDAFIEPMTLWRPVYTDKQRTEISAYYPSNMDYGRAMWKRFGSFLVTRSDAPDPGIIKWLKCLVSHSLIEDNYISRMKTIYSYLQDSQKSCYFDMKTDSLNIHVRLLSEQSEEWRTIIEKEITLTQQVADIYGVFFLDMQKASDMSTRKAESQVRAEGATIFYGAIDAQIRKWLSSLNANPDTKPEEAAKTWERELFTTADALTKQEVLESGAHAIIGHDVEGKRINSAVSYFKFWNIIRKSTEHELEKVHWNIRYHSDRTDAIRKFVHNRLMWYGENLDSSETKRDLAIIRRCVGRPMLDCSDALRIVFAGFPTEFRSKPGRLSKTETAVFATFIIFAIYQQGSEKNLFDPDTSFGTAARHCARAEHHRETPEDFDFVRKYMDRILCAESVEVFMIHFVYFIRLVRKWEIGFDFEQLAHDLFLFQIEEHQLSAKLAWEMDFIAAGRKTDYEESEEKPKKKSKRLKPDKNKENKEEKGE